MEGADSPAVGVSEEEKQFRNEYEGPAFLYSCLANRQAEGRRQLKETGTVTQEQAEHSKPANKIFLKRTLRYIRKAQHLRVSSEDFQPEDLLPFALAAKRKWVLAHRLKMTIMDICVGELHEGDRLLHSVKRVHQANVTIYLHRREGSPYQSRGLHGGPKLILVKSWAVELKNMPVAVEIDGRLLTERNADGSENTLGSGKYFLSVLVHASEREYRMPEHWLVIEDGIMAGKRSTVVESVMDDVNEKKHGGRVNITFDWIPQDRARSIEIHRDVLETNQRLVGYNHNATRIVSGVDNDREEDKSRKKCTVVFRYYFDDGNKCKVDTRVGFECPWCADDCRDLYGLMMHMSCVHVYHEYSMADKPDNNERRVTVHVSLAPSQGRLATTYPDLGGQLGRLFYFQRPPPALLKSRQNRRKLEGCVPPGYLDLESRELRTFWDRIVRPPTEGTTHGDGTAEGGRSRRKMRDIPGEGGEDGQEDEVDDGDSVATSVPQIDPNLPDWQKIVYFHGMTRAPVHMDDLDKDSESEDGPMDWLRDRGSRLMDEFRDLNNGEKALMKLWNSHALDYKPLLGVCHLERASEIFIERYGAEIHRLNLRNNLLLWLLTHCDHHPNYDAESVPRLMEKYDRMFGTPPLAKLDPEERARISQMQEGAQTVAYGGRGMRRENSNRRGAKRNVEEREVDVPVETGSETPHPEDFTDDDDGVKRRRILPRKEQPK